MRAFAATTAGRLPDDTHLSALRSLADGDDDGVAAAALFALARHRDVAALPIAASSLHRAPARAAQSAWLLGELGAPARDALVTALGDPSLAPSVREGLLLAAARLRPVPAAAIAPWVASADSGVAWRAAYALARGRAPGGVRVLVDAARSPWGSVRAQAARGLARAVAGDSLGGAALDALQRLARDGDPHVRIGALRSLASYGDAGGAALREALADADANVRLAAAQVVAPAIGTDTAAWRQALGRDTVTVIREALLAGAVRQGAGADLLATWRRDGDWHRRAMAATLDALGVARVARGRLAGWTRDGDPRVRAAAVAGLAGLVDSATVREGVRHDLAVQLADEDVGVRTAALDGLAHGASADDLARALVAYRRTGDEPALDARLAFWALADSARRHDGALPDSVARELRALPRPRDPLEREAASRLPGFAEWRDPTSPARPLAWYADRVQEALATRQPQAVVETERGTLVLDLLGSEAPITVYQFAQLARTGYFDGQRFHRVVPDFVVQGGDPRGDGNGGPGYAIRDEISTARYLRGTLGMALSGPDTGGSQFFVTLSPQPHLDGGYTVFGRLHSGGDILDRLVQGDRIVRVTIR